MKRLISATLTALALVAIMAMPTLGNHPGDRDCPSFDSQAQAQAFFIRHGGPESDGDRLDGNDDDGKACETYDYASNNGPDPEEPNEEEPAEEEPNEEEPAEEPEMPPTSTDSSSTGATLPLLLSVLGLGTFGLMLRRRLGLSA